MALLFPRKPAIFNQGQLRVANIYSRPALAPFYQGLRGFGQARRTSAASFEETLRSFATSPFAVNSQTYMEMIRERYGFDDKQLQDTLGIIGGVVGAGTAAAIQGGLFLKTKGITLTESRRTAQAQAGFRRFTPTQIDLIGKYNIEASKVSDAVKKLSDAAEANKAADSVLLSAEEAYKKVKKLNNLNPAKKAAKEALDLAKKKAADTIKTLSDLNKARNNVVDTAKIAADAARKAGLSLTDDAVSLGTKLATRAGGFLSYAGDAVDILSLGLSSAALAQDIQAGDVGSAVLSGVEVLGDAVSVVGNFVDYALPGVGTAISAVGTLVSMGTMALRVGFSIGQAAGRSLSPSGLKAQQLFAENIAANVSARPISTLTAITIQVGLPYLIGRAGSKYVSEAQGGSLSNRLLYALPNFLGNDVLGNQVRAGITMAVSQTVAPLTQQVDALLPTYNPEGADFVSAISLFGDLQDNLFGATRTKSILLGLASNDPNAKRDALARAWGYSEKPSYVLTAADIVEEIDALKKAPPIVKSVLGVVGEIVLDPRNFDEMTQGKIKTERTRNIGSFLENELRRAEVADLIGDKSVVVNANVKKLIDQTTRGIFRDTNNPKTRGLIMGAVNAYLEGGTKTLEKYLTESAMQTYKGVKIGDLATDVLSQVDAFKNIVDEVITGTYVSPITVNNRTAKRLLTKITEQQRILEEYSKTGKLPANIQQAEIETIRKFIGLVGSRYGAESVDIVAKKMLNDLNIKPDVTQIQKFYRASDAFANYMELTDKLNSGLIFALNPIGRLIQLGEGRLLRLFNESTRTSMNTIENRMRTLTTLKSMKDNLDKLPTFEELKTQIEQYGNEETLLKNLIAPNRELTRSEELLFEDIKNNMKNDPEYKIIGDALNNTREGYNILVENVKKQITAIQDNKSNFTFRTIDYKIGNNTSVTIDATNYQTYYKELEDLRALETPTKEQTQKRTALSAAFVDYELAVNNSSLFEKVIQHYETSITILNLASTRADDYALNVLEGLYAFKSYFNTMIPRKATEQLQLQFTRLSATERKATKDLDDQNEKLNKLLEKQKEFEDQYEKDFLSNDKDYQEVLKNVRDARERIAVLETTLKPVNEERQKNVNRLRSFRKRKETFENKFTKDELKNNKEYNTILNVISDTSSRIAKQEMTLKEKIKLNREQYEELQKRIRNGETEPETFVNAFDAKRFEEVVEKLNALQRVNLLNGVTFEVEYTDKNGNKVKEVFNNETDYVKITSNAKEINDVSIVLKNNFQLEINKLLNQYLGKDVFEDLLNYSHKHFDIDLKQWSKLNPEEKIKTIISYINESNLTKTDKDKLLAEGMLRKIYVSIEATAKTNQRGTTTILADELSSATLYRYVMQENIKLYKDGSDPEKINNPITQAFVRASQLIKSLDDQVASITKDSDDFTKELLEELKGRFENSLKNTPIYRYVKTYLYEYVQHNKNNLTLFKRSTLSEILPENITDYDIKRAYSSEAVANNMANNFMSSDFVEALLNPVEIKVLRKQSLVKFKMNTKGTLNEDEAKLKDQVLESFNKAENERIEHELDSETAKQVTDEAALDDTKLTEDEKKNKVLEKVREDKFSPTSVKTQFAMDSKSLPNTKDKRTALFAKATTVRDLFTVNNFILLPEYVSVRLNMTKLYDTVTDSDFTILKYLKDNKRSNVEHKERVGTFAFKLALLYRKYGKDLNILDGKNLIKNTLTVEELTEKFTEMYLNKGGINVRIILHKDGSDDSRRSNQRDYTNLFKRSLIEETKTYLNTKEDAVAKEFLINASQDKNQYNIIDTLVDKANERVHKVMNLNKGNLVFFETLNDLIVELRDFEISLKRSISEYNAELSPAIRKKAILSSVEVRDIFRDMAQARSDKNPEEYNHLFFKLIHVVKDFYTEDYATKTVLRNFDNFNEIKIVNGEVIFVYKTDKMSKAIEYNLFDLLFIHGLTKSDYNRFVETIGQRMATSLTADQVKDISAAALVGYDMMVQEYGQILTHNAFSIDREVFLKQKGATQELFELFTDPAVMELRQRLRLVNTIFEQDMQTNKIDFAAYYDNRYRTYNSFIVDAIKKYNDDINSGKPTKTTLDIYATDKDGNKKVMFTLNLLDNGSLKNKDALLLNLLIKLTTVDAADFAGYTIKSPEGNEQTAVINQENVKKVIRDIFFKDSKAVKGKAQNTNIDLLEKRLEYTTEQSKEYNLRYGLDKGTIEYKRTTALFKTREKVLKSLIAYYKKINASIEIDPFNNFDEVLQRMIDDEGLIQAYFLNTVNTDGNDFVLALDPDNKYRLYRTKDIPDFKEQNTGKGIPRLNQYFVDNVFEQEDKTYSAIAKAKYKQLKKESPQFEKTKLVMLTNNGDVIITVPDQEWSFAKLNDEQYRNAIKNSINSDGEYLAFDVYVVSESKYKEMESISKAKKKDIPNVDIYKVEDRNIKPIPEILNVQGSKLVTDLWLSDLNLIYKERLDDSTSTSILLKKLSDFYAQRFSKTNLQGFVPVLKSYGSGVNLFNTGMFKQLVEDSQVNVAFFEFFDLIGKANYDLETIGSTFFKPKFITNGYALQNIENDLDPVLVARLKEKGLFDKVINALQIIQTKYGKTTLVNKLNYNNVLKPETTTEILRLKNSIFSVVKYVEKTNRTLYNKILPIIEKHVERQMSEDISAQNVSVFLNLDRELNSVFYSKLGKTFRDPYKKDEDLIKLFKREKNARYNDMQNFSVLNVQQYYFKSLHDIVKKAKAKHFELYKKYKKDSINYLNFTSLRTLFKDFRNKNISGEDLFNKLETLIFENNEVKETFKNKLEVIANDIYAKQTTKVFQSAKEITNHLLYGYVLKSYLVSIKQFMDRNISNQNEAGNAAAYYNLLLNAESVLKTDLKNKTITETDKRNLEEIQKRLKNMQLISDNKIRYSYNNDHLIYRGNSTDALFNYQVPLAKEFEEEKRTGVIAPIENIKIDEYISEYVLDKFGVNLEPSQKVELTGLASDAILFAAEYLYTKETKESKRYISESGTLETEVKKTSALIAELKNDGFTDEEIRVITDLAVVNNASKAFIKDTDTFNKLFTESDPLRKDKINSYIENIKKIKQDQFKINRLELSYEEIFEINRLDLLEKSTKFFTYLKNVLRGGDATDTEDIVKTLSTFGIKREMVFRLLDDEFETVEHFVNAIVKDNKDPKGDAYDKANILMLFINYHKNLFINEKLNIKNYTSDNIKNIIRIEKIRDKNNTLDLMTLNINDVFGEGNSITNSVNFYFNKGFTTLRKIGSRVNFSNDRLDHIIFDNKNLKDNEEYTGDEQGIIFKQNNVKVLASEIQRTTYEPLFKETDAGFTGGRTYELMLLRRDFIQDIMTENMANKLEEVGSGNVLYNNIRITWTGLMSLIKPNFKPREFVRVRDVASAILLFSKQKQTSNFFVETYNSLMNEAKRKYILDNASRKKSSEELAEEFDKSIKEAEDKILKLFYDNNKLVDLDQRGIKVVLGYIYTSRFVDAKDIPAMQDALSESVTKQIKEDIKYKQYKFNTISNVVKRIIKDNTIEDIEERNKNKRKLLASLQGKTFNQLSKEQQETINTALRIHDFINSSANFYSADRWYDTFDVAYGKKNRIGATTTITMQNIADEESGIKVLEDSVIAKEEALNNSIKNTRDIKKQNNLFKIEKAANYNYEENSLLVDVGDINKQADLATFILEGEIEKASNKVAEEEKIFKQKKLELIRNLFELYPGLRRFYLDKKEESVKSKLDEAILNIEKLNKGFNASVVKEYNKYEKDVEAIKAIENENEYKAVTLFAKEFEQMLVNGTPADEALRFLFDFYKEELAVYNITTVKELISLYVKEEKVNKYREKIKALRDKRDARGKEVDEKIKNKNKKFSVYLEKRANLQKNIERLKEQQLALQLSDVDSIDTDLDILSTLIQDFKKESTIDLERTFSTIDKKDNFEQLTDTAKKLILERHNSLKNKRFGFLKAAYVNIRKTNLKFGNAGDKDLGDVVNDKLIKPEVLLSALEKEVEILSNHRETLKGLIIENIPQQITGVELEGNEAFKIEMYFRIAYEIQIEKQSKRLKRQLTSNEVDKLINDVSIQFERIDNVIAARNYVFNRIQNERSYNAQESEYGSTGVTISFETFNEEQIRFAEAVISNVNNKLINGYNDSIEKLLASTSKSLVLISQNVDELKTEIALVQRVNKVPTVQDSKNSKKLFNNLYKEIQGAAISNIDDQTLNTLLRFISNSTSSQQIRFAKEALETLEKKKESIEKFKKEVNSVDVRRDDISKLKETIKTRREFLIKKYAALDSTYKDELAVAGDKLNNLSVFKHYYNIDKDETEVKVIDKVLKLIKDRFPKQNINNLKKYISSRGDYAIHNSVVDSLITLLNYNHQKPSSKNYVVVDLETYKLNGEDVPYQMTMIFEKDGELVINDIFINSAIFFDGLNDDGTYKDNMIRFYEQQKSIWKEQWAKDNLSNEAFEAKAKAKMDELIARVQLVKNNDNFINTFLRLTGDNNVEIVAHNGFRFDFNIIKRFISRIGDNLIVNEYYRNLREESDVKKIYETIDKTNLNDDEVTTEYIKELQKEFTKTEAEFNTKLPSLTSQEADIYLRRMDIVATKLTEVKIKQRIKAAQEESGYILNDKIREQIFDVSTGAIKYINDQLYKYLNTTDVVAKADIKNDLVLKFMEGVSLDKKNANIQRIIIEYVDKLIVDVEKTYNEFITGTSKIKFGSTKKGTSINTQTVEEAFKIAGVTLYENDIEIDVKVKIDVINNAIETNKRLIEALQLGTKAEDIVSVRTEEIKSLEEAITEGKKEIDLLKKEQSKLQVSNDNIVERIITVTQKINNNTQGYARTIGIALNNITAKTGNATGPKALTLLQNQYAVSENNVKVKTQALLNLADAIRTDKTFNPEDLKQVIDQRLIDVFNGILTKEEALKQIDVEINTLLKAEKNLTDSSVKAVLKTVFDEFIKQHVIIVNKTKTELTIALKELLRLKEFKGISIVDNEVLFNGQPLTVKALADMYQIITDVDNQKFFEDNTVVVSKVVRSLRTYEESLNYSQINFEQLITDTRSDLFDVFKTVVNERFNALKQTKVYLENYTVKQNVQDSSLDIVMSAYNSVIFGLTGLQNDLDSLKNETILSLITGEKPSNRMSNEEYDAVSSSVLNLEEINEDKSLQKLGVSVVYDDAEKGNDIQVVRLVSNKVLGNRFEGESANTYVFTVLDDTYNEVNSVMYNTNNKKLTIKLKYAYLPAELKYTGGNSKGYQTQEKTIEVDLSGKSKSDFTFSFKDLEKFLEDDNFYWRDTKSPEKFSILPYVTQDSLHFVNGIDSSKEAITTLIKWVISNKENFVTKNKNDDNETIKDKLKKADEFYNKVLTHEKFGFNAEYLKIINISEMIKNQFFAELSLYQANQKLNSANIKEIYAGIYNRITSRYKALEAGSIINQINDEYTYNYNLDNFDAKFLEEYNIDLGLSSEGSSGAVFKYKTRYQLNFPFNLSVNPIRTILSAKHILAKYTTVGFLNAIYKDIETKQAPGKFLLTTFLKDPYKYIEKQVADRLIRKTKDSKTQIFMPNVMSPELYDAYKKDSMVHQFGITTEVAFVNDPRIPLDTIAIDADFARETKWGQGNKTWLGLQDGFKGAVELVPGLYKTYGANFASQASSVFSRGTAGIYGEMLFNYIRAYLVDETTEDGNSVIPVRTRKYFEGIDSYLRETFSNQINKEDNVLSIDGKTTYEIFEELANVLADTYKDDPFFKTYNGKTVTKEQMYSLLLVRDFNELSEAEFKDIPEIITPTIIKPNVLKQEDLNKDTDFNQIHKRVRIKTDLKNTTYIKGLIYVYADHENSAQSMQTITKVNTAGKLIRNVVDSNNNPVKGTSLSPTAVTPIFAKIGQENFFKVFKPDFTNVNLLSDIRSLGFKTVIKNAIGLEKEEDLDSEDVYNALLQKLVQARTNKVIHEYAYLQGVKYLNLLYTRNTTKSEVDGFEKEIDRLVKTTESNVLTKIYDTKNSAYYQSIFKRWDGIRQQYLADVTLDAGEIILSRDSWEAIKSKDPDNTRFKTEAITDKEKANLYIDTALQYKTLEEQEEYLNSRGIFREENEALYIALEVGIGTKDLNKFKETIKKFTLNQTYTYLLSARSPVQDYAAVPVLKAIGYSKSYAAKVNVYAYNMMGADNDGDTFGMALLKINDVEGADAPLRRLLATDLNYYTYDEKVNKKDGTLKTYLEKSNEEMFGGDSLANNIHDASAIDLISYKFTRNYTGKNTFSKYEIDDIEYNIRADKEYLEVELYRLISPDMLSQLGSVVENKVTALDTSNEKLLRLYVNAHTRMNNQGSDFNNIIKTFNDYGVKEKLEDYYNENKEAIDLIYTIEKALVANEYKFGLDIILSDEIKEPYLKYFSKEEQDSIEDKNNEKLYKRFVRFALFKKAEQFTISRIRASKNGVNEAGNKRKDQFISSLLSTYPRINLSKQGEFWKAIGATANKEGEVTVRSLLDSILGKNVITYVEDDAGTTIIGVDKALEKLYAIKNGAKTGNSKLNNPQGSLRYFVEDLPLIINDLIRVIETYNSGKNELKNLSDLLNKTSPTIKDYLDFVKGSSKANDPVIARYIVHLETKNKADVISKNFVDELLIHYFNDAKTLESFREDKLSIDQLLSGYFEQFIIERVALNNMSRLIQKAISQSKHDGLDTNPNARFIDYQKEVANITTRKAIRKVMLGTNNLENLYGMAINTDRKIRERANIKIEKGESANKEYFENNPNKRVVLKATYVDEADAVTDIQELITQRAKLFLLGNLFMPDSYVQTLNNKIKMLNNALRNPTNYLNNKEDLLNAIRYFEAIGIPFYKLSTYLRDVLSIKQVVSERYVKKYQLNTKNVKLIENSRNVLTLFYRLREPDFKEKFEAQYKDEKEVLNFFNNVNDMTEGWYVIDEEGNREFIDPNSDPLPFEIAEAVTQEEVHTAYSVAGSNNGKVLEKTTEELSEDKINIVSNNIKDRLKYATFTTEVERLDTIVDNAKTEINLILLSLENIKDLIVQTKKTIEKLNLKTTAQNELKTKRVRNAIRDEANSKQYAKLTDLQNKKEANETRISELEKLVVQKEKEKNGLNISLKNVERIKDWYSTGEDPIAKLEQENKDLVVKKEEIQQQALRNAVINNLGGGVLLLRTVDGYGLGDSNIGKPRYLTQEDLDNKRNEATLAMSNKVTLLTNMVDSNNEDRMLKIIYDVMKQKQGQYRLVVVQDPLEDEGAYKSIVDKIRRFDPTKDTSDKLYEKFTSEEYKALKFNKIEELEKWQADGGKVVFEGKVYEAIDKNIIIKNNKALTPTYKELPITSFKQLKEYYEFAKGQNALGVRPIIGFIDLNTWMQAMEQTYTIRKKPSAIQSFVWKLQLGSKNLSKFSVSFLFRNMNDTVYQLFSNAQILPKAVDSKDFMHMTMTSIELYNLYKQYSDEHTATLINVGLFYEDIMAQLKMPVADPKIIDSNINLMKEVLESYITIGKTIQEENSRIKYNLNQAERLLNAVKNIDNKNVKGNTRTLYDIATFISNIKFGEYIELYDNRVIDGTLVAGLRVDGRDENGKPRKGLAPLSKIMTKEDLKWKKKLLKELSAFMNTAATSDYLRKDNFELLPQIFENYRGYNDNDFSVNTYEEIQNMIKDQRNVRRYNRGHWPFKDLSSRLIDGYDRINSVIENGARITNFFYNLMIYNKTFDESVTASLRSWFNYGMRSPLEQRLAADIPFISFPIRSLENWIDRLNNPRWWRFMSDFFDGWYGQYIDEEEKEYSDYIKYQMRNGWIPLSKNFGIRIGNGGLDVMNILYNTQEAFEGRLSPLLRGVKTLVEKRNVFEALNQLATAGFIGRIANTITGASDMALGTNLRQQASQVPVLRETLDTRQATIGTTFRGFAYDIYNTSRFTPRRYQYSRNGRYAKYENIYKDYFNKYGRFRSNAASPYRLVKNIQWRQYVRYRQSQAIIGRR